MDISAILASISSGIGIAKTLKDIEGDYQSVEIKAKVIELMGTLMEAKEQLLEAKEELRKKDEEIKSLKENFSNMGESLIDEDGFLYDKDENGKKTGRPYCPHCHGTQGKLIRLQRHAIASIKGVRCTACGNSYSL